MRGLASTPSPWTSDHVVYLLPAAVVGGLASIYTRAYRQYRVAGLTT